MKIIIINNLYKPYNRGGAEKVCERIVSHSQEQGSSIVIITTKPKDSFEINTETKTYYLNSNYYNLEKKSLFYRLFWQIGNFFNFNQSDKLKEIIEKENPQTIITNNLMGIGWKTFKIIKKLNIKHHHILHDIQLIHPSGLMFFGQEKKINSIVAKIYQKLIKKMIGSPDLIISPSNWLLQEHLKRNYFPNSQSKIQKNPAPFSNIENLKLNNLQKNKEIINFIFIGQITKHKGIIFLINSFKKINNPKINLNIIGDGPLLKEIKLISRDDNRIKILGEKTKEEIALELQKNDCLIIPSQCYENSPTVIYEAKAFSLPIIASDLGGIPELLDINKDLSFYPGDEKGLAEKIDAFSKKTLKNFTIDKNNNLL
ncbi:MAG TPA: glycosyltransferase [bacterium]|nr:glycosyltransferase [bacterium]